MFSQKFALSTKERIDRCKSALGSFSATNVNTFSSLSIIQQELNALEGEAQLLNFNVLQPLINVILDNLDTTREGASPSHINRGLNSIWYALRMWVAKKMSDKTVPALVDYVLGKAPFPEEIERASIFPEDAYKKILFIDDSEITREMIQFSLEAEGHEVVVAGDLITFDRILEHFKPHIILTDVNMPDVQGDQICRVLKSKYDTANIPIILFSSLDEEHLIKLADRAGADGYVSKQHGIESLIKQINELVDLMLW